MSATAIQCPTRVSWWEKYEETETNALRKVSMQCGEIVY